MKSEVVDCVANAYDGDGNRIKYGYGHGDDRTCDECAQELPFRYIRMIVFEELAYERVFCSFKCMIGYVEISLEEEMKE